MTAWRQSGLEAIAAHSSQSAADLRPRMPFPSQRKRRTRTRTTQESKANSKGQDPCTRCGFKRKISQRSIGITSCGVEMSVGHRTTTKKCMGTSPTSTSSVLLSTTSAEHRSSWRWRPRAKKAQQRVPFCRSSTLLGPGQLAWGKDGRFRELSAGPQSTPKSKEPVGAKMV